MNESSELLSFRFKYTEQHFFLFFCQILEYSKKLIVLERCLITVSALSDHAPVFTPTYGLPLSQTNHIILSCISIDVLLVIQWA